jgi:uncharacterized protein YprB with RNaseH-like and TPR domain
MFLDLVEKDGSLFVWDTESQGREGDYGRMYTVSIKPFGKEPESYIIGENMQDKGMVKEAADRLAQAKCWITFYGKGHDVPLMNTRLIRWGYDPLPKIHHVDMFYQLVNKLKTGRKSQAHLLEFLEDTMEIMGINRSTRCRLARMFGLTCRRSIGGTSRSSRIGASRMQLAWRLCTRSASI